MKAVVVSKAGGPEVLEVVERDIPSVKNSLRFSINWRHT